MANGHLGKVSRFSLVYAIAVGAYYMFDFIYMPWLAIVFGWKLFLPLYPSIVIANFAGVYAYDYFKEDVLFIQLGKNWLRHDSAKFTTIRGLIDRNKWLAFVALSIWPSPIASYLFFRKVAGEPSLKILKVIAVGSIFCTAFWGFGLSIIISVVSSFMKLF
jgi:hypothetical protein